METKYLGKQINGPVIELDTFPNPGIDVVIMVSDEVTSFCPVTGQPDYYTVSIEYQPNQFCIESKSLKLYLWHFRDQAIFAEALAVEIKNNVVATIAPKSCIVITTQKSRGGIVITSKAIYD